MSKFASVLAVLVFLGASLCSADYYEVCDVYFNKCSASASINISVRGTGKCYASASSYCKAWADFESCSIYSDIYEDGICRDVYIGDDVTCYAKASAKAIADAYASAVCEGKSAYACADASAHAEAQACAVASAIVRLSVYLDHENAQCYADVEAVVQAIANAVANAQASVCADGDGIPAFDSDYEFAEAVQYAIARAYASCVVYCDGKDAWSYVSGGASGSTSGYTYTYGGGYADIGDH